MCICICDAGRLNAAPEVHGACMVRLDCTFMLFVALAMLWKCLAVRHLSDTLEVPRLVALVYLLDAEDAPGLVTSRVAGDLYDAQGALHRQRAAATVGQRELLKAGLQP
eukprot:scaffold65488_cov87-Phaeocystis_antarctica.AAC.3